MHVTSQVPAETGGRQLLAEAGGRQVLAETESICTVCFASATSDCGDPDLGEIERWLRLPQISTAGLRLSVRVSPLRGRLGAPGKRRIRMRDMA